MLPVQLSNLTNPDPALAEPMPVQIYRDLLSAIRDGRLADGARLPSSRAAAQALGLSRTTLNTAYDLLRAEGVLTVRQGAAPRVTAPQMQAAPEPGRGPPLSARGQGFANNPRSASYATAQGVMTPGVPDETLFPRDEWAVALRRAGRGMHGDISAYGEPHGIAALRKILAERLAADRGLRADPGRILITTSTQSSVSLLALTLSDPGDVAAMEDPGYLGARAAFTMAGLNIRPLPIDAEGVRVDAVPPEARLIYVSPSNQYPLGVRLSLHRRMELIERARAQRAMILEDDYGSEFLWRGREIATLAAHGPGEVAYLGSAAKVLMPALRIGWMVVPDDLVDPLRAAQRNLGITANLHAQLALADFMGSGRYRTHLRRIARAYEARGQALTKALEGLPGLTVRAPDGGVQLAAVFDPPRDELPVMQALAAKGFRPARLSAMSETGLTGLVIGFADATPARISRFRDVLADALAQIETAG